MISGNNDQGVKFGSNGTGNVVLGNYIGTNPAGDAAVPNAENGIEFADASAQTIGGAAAGAGNLISGNAGSGVIVDSQAFPPGISKIQGNTIGLAADGVTPLPNGGAGVFLNDVADVQLGGSVAGAGNVISGNSGTGVDLVSSDGTRIQGNLIGLTAAGDAGVPNGASAVIVNSSDDLQIGGTTAGARNVIAGGPTGAGVLLDSGSTDNTVQGNYIGTDITGETGIASSSGVVVAGGSQATIGGVVTGAGNVISGHSGSAVQLDLSVAGSRVLGNSIGTDKDETTSSRTTSASNWRG